MKFEKTINKNGIAGYKECPKFLKDAYLRAIKECQACGQTKELEPHRLTRGNKGGLYTVWPINKKGSNVKILCKDCHKQVHANENTHVSHSY